MTKGAKIFMGVGCGLLLIGAVVVVGGFIALNYIEARLGESTKAFEIKGREFGKTTDQQGCIIEGLRRSKSATILDFDAGLTNSAFVDACLEASRPTTNFCDGVPSLWSMNDSEWKADQCRKAGLDPERTGCVHVFKRKQEACGK